MRRRRKMSRKLAVKRTASKIAQPIPLEIDRSHCIEPECFVNTN